MKFYAGAVLAAILAYALVSWYRRPTRVETPEEQQDREEQEKTAP